jgi:hypothetical protein
VGSVIFDFACPQCGCTAVGLNEYKAGVETGLCHGCGWGQDEDGTRTPGVGCYACGKGERGGIVQCGSLDKPADQFPFPPDAVAECGFLWYSRETPDGWEGVLVKGQPNEDWPVGLIPKYAEVEERRRKEEDAVIGKATDEELIEAACWLYHRGWETANADQPSAASNTVERRLPHSADVRLNNVNGLLQTVVVVSLDLDAFRHLND